MTRTGWRGSSRPSRTTRSPSARGFSSPIRAPHLKSRWARPCFRTAMRLTRQPSCHQAAVSPIRNAAWEAVGGYPEWLDYCEDVVFDLALRAARLRIAFVPDALVRFRPRGTMRAFWHQYFRYARGDGKAGLWPKRHAIRYLTYGGLISLVLLGKRGAPAWPLVIVGAICYLRQPYARLRPVRGGLVHRTASDSNLARTADSSGWRRGENVWLSGRSALAASRIAGSAGHGATRWSRRLAPIQH